MDIGETSAFPHKLSQADQALLNERLWQSAMTLMEAQRTEGELARSIDYAAGLLGLPSGKEWTVNFMAGTIAPAHSENGTEPQSLMPVMLNEIQARRRERDAAKQAATIAANEYERTLRLICALNGLDIDKTEVDTERWELVVAGSEGEHGR